ncbi:hypothetical protein O181_082710 [Austropuccinia psidii MF-1]|uniref:Uncharacterized protein n=1 Tax=Austropuccinia psidii MF-1 TaxID=1389203 RepID=A0A9Q3IL36_9BASI|nr:hypothetical protein [Austropuccinia psidii MF-1]
MPRGLQQGSQRCVLIKAHWDLGTILDPKRLRFKWEEAVSDILSASTQSDPSTLGIVGNLERQMRPKLPERIGFLPALDQQHKYQFQYQPISPQVKFGGLWMSIRSNAFTLATWQFSLQPYYSFPLLNSDHLQQ